jgi:hypothetical protein
MDSGLRFTKAQKRKKKGKWHKQIARKTVEIK